MPESDGVTVLDLPVEAVVYRDDVYPREEKNPLKVQEYAESLEWLPPIEVNQDYVLIDGWHRWMAHQKAQMQTIKAKVITTKSDVDILLRAMRTNARHGLQLSLKEKRDKARFIYNMTPVRDRHTLKSELKEILAVSEKTLNNWFDRIDRDTRNSQRERCFDTWLACHTQEEIAERVGLERRTVSDWIQCFGDFGKLSDSAKTSGQHSREFQIPQKNVWTEHDTTPHLNFPGSTEPRWVDNLLYFYTKPFDIVIDPFAGSGSTINICKKRLRRYWVSDRKPIVERAHEIRLWDMTEGLPPLHNWRDAKLVYLDPPYWKQAEGDYSQDPSDLANMPLETFTEALREVIAGFAKKLHTGAHIALIIQPTHWHSPDHAYIDHAMDMVKAIALPLARRIACPYDTPCYTEYLKWAMENREMLSLNREIIVWRVP